MAKKHLYLTICCFVLLCGCQHNNKTSLSNQNDSSNIISSNQYSEDDKIDITSLNVTKGRYSEHDNTIVHYTSEEAKTIVSASSDYKISDDCYFNIPKTINHVSTFVKRYPEHDELYDFYRSYMIMYKYLFPDDAFDDNNLFFFGKNSNGSEGYDKVKTIGKNFIDFLSEEKKNVYYMFYSPYFYKEQPLSTDSRNHFLELSSPVGTIMANFNKGILAEYISNLNQTPNNKFLETYTLPYMFSARDSATGELVGFENDRCSIDSDEKYTMLDGKELSVKDAVKFFEDYINTLPYPENPNLDIKVTSVTAEDIDNGKHCYSFNCTTEFEGIPFDHTHYGTYIINTGNNGYESSVRMGYMSVSDDVDAVYGFCRKVDISEKSDEKRIVSLEDALKCCENSLTEYIDWELHSAELVYCAGNETEAESPYQYREYTVSPCYKFILYNSNDALCYSAYVDAITGEFSHYYTTKASEEE